MGKNSSKKKGPCGPPMAEAIHLRMNRIVPIIPSIESESQGLPDFLPQRSFWGWIKLGGERDGGAPNDDTRFSRYL
jgi:hypothetical protein